MFEIIMSVIGIGFIAIVIMSITDREAACIHPIAICIGAPLLLLEMGFELPKLIVFYAFVMYFVLSTIHQRACESETKKHRFVRVCISLLGWFFAGLLITVLAKYIFSNDFPGFMYGVPIGIICAIAYIPYVISRFKKEDLEKEERDREMEEDRIRREKEREERARREEERRRESNNRTKREQKRKQRQNTPLGRDKGNLVYFRGCHDVPSVKTMYRKLSKRYHPDNKNGDAEKFKAMQAEYQEVMKKYA